MAIELTKKQWKLLIAEIIIDYNELNNECINLDDYEEFNRFCFNYGVIGEVMPGLSFVDEDGEMDSVNYNRHYCYIIFKWKDVFYKFTWEYFSHRGVDFDCASMYIVEPVLEDKISFISK